MIKYHINLNLLRKKRIEHHYSQQYMADQLGIQTRTGYNFKEKGRREFTAAEIPVLANVLNIPISQIFVKEQ